jgi:hypothetical protein
VALALATGCGLRSDPLFEGVMLEGGSEADDDSGGDDGTGPRKCESPVAMPAQNVTVKGTLKGDDTEGGWCGSDDGPEIVYELLAPYTTDITLRLLTSEVPLTLRVEEGACGSDEAALICAEDFVEQPRHFLALGGTTYYITVDTDEPGGGSFEFGVEYGWPTPDLCHIHDTAIIQMPGGSFQWFNDFGKSQGYVDGYCGGPGRENMFAVTTTYAGNMYANVSAQGGFEPVLSIRTNCAGVSELVCDSDTANGYAEASWFLEPPNTYYIAVDQMGYDGGSYELYVWFD